MKLLHPLIFLGLQSNWTASSFLIAHIRIGTCNVENIHNINHRHKSSAVDSDSFRKKIGHGVEKRSNFLL